MPRNAAEPSSLSLRDPARGIRLQKAMADAGVGSRRTCEELIERGHVEINGRFVRDLPVFVDPSTDRIVVDGRPLKRQPAGSSRRIYLMLNKPTRTLTTAADNEELDSPGVAAGRRTVLDFVDHPAKERLFPVGRLDYETTGLILLTNDGELANRLTHPRYGVHKTYRAVVKGLLADEEIEALEKGIYLAERREGQTVGAKRTAHVSIEIVRRDRDRTILNITLAEGRNRQVRRMLVSVGHPVKKLTRIAMGPVELKGVALGNWRELDRAEIRALREAAGLKRVSTARKKAGTGASRRERRREAGDERSPRGGAGEREGRKGRGGTRGTGAGGAGD